MAPLSIDNNAQLYLRVCFLIKCRFGSGKWRQILDSYNFDNRTTTDLKDKYRNIQRKQERDRRADSKDDEKIEDTVTMEGIAEGIEGKRKQMDDEDESIDKGKRKRRRANKHSKAEDMSSSSSTPSSLSHSSEAQILDETIASSISMDHAHHHTTIEGAEISHHSIVENQGIVHPQMDSTVIHHSMQTSDIAHSHHHGEIDNSEIASTDMVVAVTAVQANNKQEGEEKAILTENDFILPL